MSLVDIFLYSFVTLAWLFMLSVLLVTWPRRNGTSVVQKPGEVRRQRQLRLRRPPQVQAVGMVIDVLGLGRVKLRYALIIIPEQGFDVTHLIPGRGAFAQRSVFLAARDNRDMLPARLPGGITSNDLEHGAGLREGDRKQAAAGFRRSAIFIACEPPLLNQLWERDTHDFCLSYSCLIARRCARGRSLRFIVS